MPSDFKCTISVLLRCPPHGRRSYRKGGKPLLRQGYAGWMHWHKCGCPPQPHCEAKPMAQTGALLAGPEIRSLKCHLGIRDDLVADPALGRDDGRIPQGAEKSE